MDETTKPDSPWKSADEAAEYVGLGRRAIYKACGSGKLRHIRVNGRREIRTTFAWLDSWLEADAHGGEVKIDGMTGTRSRTIGMAYASPR